MVKKKSFYYGDWRYKVRWNERATPVMCKHMNISNLVGKFLRKYGAGNLFKIRTVSMLKIKLRFKCKKTVSW